MEWGGGWMGWEGPWEELEWAGRAGWGVEAVGRCGGSVWRVCEEWGFVLVEVVWSGWEGCRVGAGSGGMVDGCGGWVSRVCEGCRSASWVREGLWALGWPWWARCSVGIEPDEVVGGGVGEVCEVRGSVLWRGE